MRCGQQRQKTAVPWWAPLRSRCRFRHHRSGGVASGPDGTGLCGAGQQPGPHPWSQDSCARDPRGGSAAYRQSDHGLQQRTAGAYVERPGPRLSRRQPRESIVFCRREFQSAVSQPNAWSNPQPYLGAASAVDRGGASGDDARDGGPRGADAVVNAAACTSAAPCSRGWPPHPEICSKPEPRGSDSVAAR